MAITDSFIQEIISIVLSRIEAARNFSWSMGMGNTGRVGKKRATWQNTIIVALHSSLSNYRELFVLNRFGAKYRSTTTGIIYNNEMADFDIRGHDIVDDISPSEFNLPGSRLRPFSSMCPTILTDNSGIVRLVIGASGGKRITTAVSLVRPVVSFYAP